MAVCEYCHTAVLKDADTVQNIGTVSEVIADYSPIQLGTSGSVDGRTFSTVGRLQLRYSGGMWNEWYILFEDGSTGWLADASGEYAVMIERKEEEKFPTFESLAPTNNHTFFGRDYQVADVREAECVAGEGELPFRVGSGWKARLVDLRCGNFFLTLDYSEGDRPRAYDGKATSLRSMQCQLLRRAEEIQAGLGQYTGNVMPLNCPACGASVSIVPGVTTHVLCGACGAEADTTGAVARVLEQSRSVNKMPFSLQLGAAAKIGGVEYLVLGAMRRRDGEGAAWNEYLLFAKRVGFLWLVDTPQGWMRGLELETWPRWTAMTRDALVGHLNFKLLYQYPATVVSAIGAFNWRVRVGDQSTVYQFKRGNEELVAEFNETELTFSRSVPVGSDQLRAWFGAEFREMEKIPGAGGATDIGPFYAIVLMSGGIFILFTFEPAFEDPLYVLPIVCLVLVALVVPAAILEVYFQKKGSRK